MTDDPIESLRRDYAFDANDDAKRILLAAARIFESQVSDEQLSVAYDEAIAHLMENPVMNGAASQVTSVAFAAASVISALARQVSLTAVQVLEAVQPKPA